MYKRQSDTKGTQKKLSPTFNGVKYNITPVSTWNVIKDFFNPLSIQLRTVFTLIIICLLWVGMKYFSSGFTALFWISITLMIIIKGVVLSRLIKLNHVQNILGKTILGQTEDIDIPRYDVTAQLITDNDTSPEHVIDPIRPYVNVFGSYEDYENNVSQFSIPQRHILSVNWYISEVYGDGHYEFFTDSVGMLYIDAIKGLNAIGAEKYAIILSAAASEFDGIKHPLFDLKQRVDAINKLGLDFEKADNEIYFLDELGEEIAGLQMIYIRSHISDFIFENPLTQ